MAIIEFSDDAGVREAITDAFDRKIVKIRVKYVFEMTQELSPHNDSQRFLLSQALSSLAKVGQTRLLMVAQTTSSLPMPLLTVLVFWLTLLFMSFGLFVRPNVVVVVSLFASALAICFAVLLILDMYQPYAGLILRGIKTVAHLS